MNNRNENNDQPIYGNPTKTSIVIGYRNDQGKRMHGAFYDHYTVRKITARRVNTAHSDHQSIETFVDFIKDSTFALGVGDDLGKKIIPARYETDRNGSGLLIITGRPRDSDDLNRKENEVKLIKDAKLRGRPILGICAGSWRILESYDGKTTAVDDHCYSSMPYIGTKGTVVNNTSIHAITVTDHTILSGAMSPKKFENIRQYPEVNSVHWEAADKDNLPNELEAVAHSINHEVEAPKNRQGAQMNPATDSIEAFETKFGAPVLGIQWHPEAYYNGKKDVESKRQRNIINYMAEAGDAYQAKQRMLCELKKSMVNNVGFFNHQTKNSEQLNLVINDKRVPG